MSDRLVITFVGPTGPEGKEETHRIMRVNTPEAIDILDRRLDELTARVEKVEHEVEHCEYRWPNGSRCGFLRSEHTDRYDHKFKPTPAPSAPSGEERCAWSFTDPAHGVQVCNRDKNEMEHFHERCGYAPDKHPNIHCHPFTPPATAREDSYEGDFCTPTMTVQGCGIHDPTAKAESGKDERLWVAFDDEDNVPIGTWKYDPKLDVARVVEYVPLAALEAEMERTAAEMIKAQCLCYTIDGTTVEGVCPRHSLRVVLHRVITDRLVGDWVECTPDRLCIDPATDERWEHADAFLRIKP